MAKMAEVPPSIRYIDCGVMRLRKLGKNSGCFEGILCGLMSFCMLSEPYINIIFQIGVILGDILLFLNSNNTWARLMHNYKNTPWWGMWRFCVFTKFHLCSTKVIVVFYEIAMDSVVKVLSHSRDHLCMRPANERGHYIVTWSLIGLSTYTKCSLLCVYIYICIYIYI